MHRRTVLKGAAALGAATALGPTVRLAARPTKARLALPSILDLPAAEAPVTHVVVMMMENRSVDHFLGWLAHDEDYLEAGRRRYGARFRFDGSQDQTYATQSGELVATYHLPTHAGEPNPYRGCGHPDPGHGWNAGRAQRDGGFLAAGSGNDEFAVGYYREPDLPFYGNLARRFTTFDRYHCSLLGPTFPNREYLHAATSGGHKANDIPFDTLGFPWPTIWDRLMAAGVPARYYFVDLPTTALWGPRLLPVTSHIEHYFIDAAAGRLPNVTFVDPGFTTGFRTDDHPFADIRASHAFVEDVFRAFVASPHWEHGLFVLTYDEWGGFFDHVPPPVLPDDLASSVDADNFGQAGFRVPTFLASPYARPGFVDHRVYDHTSILRFIEWRFLGAPPEGPGGSGWWLTTRDRYANNIGASLQPTIDPELGTDLAFWSEPRVPVASAPCRGEELEGLPGAGDVPGLESSAFEAAAATGYFEAAGYRTDLGLPRELQHR
jgi:phospholipase C